MWQYTHNKKMFISMIVFGVISKWVWLAEPFIFGKIINTIQLEWKAWRYTILLYLSIFFGLTFVGWSFHGISRIREEKLKFAIKERFTTTLFHQVSSLPMHWHEDNHSWKIIDKINKATNAINEFAGNCHMHLSTVMNIIWSCIMLTVVWRPAWITVFVLIISTVFIVNRFDKKLNKYMEQKNERDHDVSSTLFDFLSNIKTVITLRFLDRALITVKEKIALVYPPFIKNAVLNERKRFTGDSISTVFMFFLVSGYIRRQFQLSDMILIGSIMMLRQYVQKMNGGFDQFTRLYGSMMQLSTDVHSIDEIQNTYTKLVHPAPTTLFDAAHPIVISGLNFSYTNQGKTNTVLKNITLTLEQGKRIALVGSSGSGKSTLMMLLRWLYPVDSVQLSIDNESFKTLEPLSHYASLIPQDPEIFEQSIRYNITMGLDVDDETILKYARLARFDDVIATLPRGLDTDIKEKWVNLSGWQKQRLALARGLLMSESSRLILLDESTSSVDVENETHIYTNIFSHYTNACIVASIHKLHLLPKFDSIIVIENGSIVETGTFTSLTQQKQWALKSLRTAYQVTVNE
jgi:ATP-binding cassette subfamily B protein